VGPLSLEDVATYPLSRRRSKVTLRAFARPHRPGESFSSFFDGLPRILAGETLRAGPVLGGVPSSGGWARTS
jgi:hypothetical protein